MDATFATRLKLFMDKMGYSSSFFADKCGIPRPSLSQLLTGRNKKVNDVLVGLIHNANPELSVMWLMFGEGEMMVSPDKIHDTNDESNLDNSIFPDNQSNQNEYLNVNGLSNANFADNITDTQRDKLQLRIQSLQEQLDEFKQNPRRVTQITIYYDDSTFDTFYPSGK